MDSSFEDDIRRAAGLPTAAEIVQRQAAEEQAAKARADDQPRQRGLIAKFQTSMLPLVDQVFKRAAAALADSDVQLVEAHTFPGSELLADKAYTIELKPEPPQRGRHSQKIRVSPLYFGIHMDGKVSAAAPDVSSAPPTLRVGTSTIKKPIEDFTLELIGGIFADYIKVAVRVARSAKSET